MYPITHANGLPDRRYSVELEHCGHAQPRHVLRFCGDFVAQSTSYPAMALRATGHRAVLNGATIIEAVDA